MTIGPVEYLIVGFPGNKFTGELAPALIELIDNNLVRILDLLFISKDTNGDLLVFEVDELDELSAFARVAGESQGVLNDEDLEHAAESLIPGSSAALLVWEDLWAVPFANALRNANAVVLEGGRIPYELVDLALAELSE